MSEASFVGGGGLLGAGTAYPSLLASVSTEHPLIGLALRSHRNTRGAPLSFVDRPYLVELYRDFPKLEGADIRKAVQTGVSELLLLLLLERAGWAGRIAAYILPTYSIRDRFVQQRINPLLDSVPDYRVRCGRASSEQGPRAAGRGATSAGAGNLKLKRFGNGALLFLGSNTAADFIEFSADMVVIDEFDQCDPSNLTKARDRLRASPNPQLFRVGNPTLPSVGISRLYDRSDRRRWFSRCSRCRWWQAIEWFAHVVERRDDGAWAPRDRERAQGGGDLRPVCERCKEPFERGALVGAWVSERPDRDRRGYAISRLDVLSESYRTLFREWVEAQADTQAIATFFASVLGVPYEHSGARLSVELLSDRCSGPEIDYAGGDPLYAASTITMGVDVGALLHVTISIVEQDDQGRPHRRALFVGTMRLFEEVADAIRRFDVDVCVIDALPETRKCKELRDEFRSTGECQVWLCTFAPTVRVDGHRYGLRQNWTDQTVQVDRTQVFDVSFDDIREDLRSFPEDSLSVLGWREQMRAPVRVLDEARQRIVWTEGTAPDHFRLSDVYDRVAYDLANSGGTYQAG
jgi:hypothetical protein